jgi:DNA-directed RNA polymerase subunit RPC12/RpoP
VRQLNEKPEQGNVNVTLGYSEAALGDLAEKEFPCPLCGAGLPILPSKRKKPYFTCNACGVQVFVRGKTGISKLKQMANAGILVSGKKDSPMHGIVLLNRLEQLKLQKNDLEWKQGIFLKDQNVENVIQTVDAEIKKIEGELADLAAKKENEK